MSGHSKWAGIKHKKALVDAKRGKLFGKLARAITVAAREGGGDPDHNATLARPSSRPKTPTCPTTTSIAPSRRAPVRAADAETYQHLTYEGYGPNGVAVYVTVLTDNKNRTAADIRYIFDRSGRQAGHRRLGQLDVRAQGRHLRRRRRARRGRAHDGRHRGRRRGRLAEGDAFEIRCDPADFMAVRDGSGGGRHQVSRRPSSP